jgi:hypothetical protein
VAARALRRSFGIEEFSHIHIMGLLANLLVTSLFCGLVTAIPGIIIFISYHRGIKKGDDSEGAKRVKKAGWVALVTWFSIGFLLTWIISAINPDM